MAFKKGQSGNPGGRPNVVGEVRALAREQTSEALEALVKIMKSAKEPAAARVSAANAILDRGYGKPAQVHFTRRIEDMTEAELVEFLGHDPTAEELSALARAPAAGSA